MGPWVEVIIGTNLFDIKCVVVMCSAAVFKDFVCVTAVRQGI